MQAKIYCSGKDIYLTSQIITTVVLPRHFYGPLWISTHLMDMLKASVIYIYVIFLSIWQENPGMVFPAFLSLWFIYFIMLYGLYLIMESIDWHLVSLCQSLLWYSSYFGGCLIWDSKFLFKFCWKVYLLIIINGVTTAMLCWELFSILHNVYGNMIVFHFQKPSLICFTAQSDIIFNQLRMN